MENNLPLATETIYSLSTLVSYSEKAPYRKVIIRKKGGDIILLAFLQGQELKEHTALIDALVQVLEGQCLITIAGKAHKLEAGQMIILPANIPHAVAAIKGNFKMLLTKIKD